MRIYPGYWVAVVATVAAVLTAPGQTMLVSLLNVPLRETFAIPTLTLNTAYTVATITASLPLVWVGQLIDRLGPRRMLALVAVCFGLACGFTALVANTLMVFVAFFALRFLGQGSLMLVSSHAVAMWFHRRLGTISGIKAVALFVAWAPLPAATLWLMGRLGWRATWGLFGAVIVIVLAGLSLLLRDRPEDLGLTLDDAPAVDHEASWSLPRARRTPAYWLLAVGNALPPMVGTAILFDLQPLLALRDIGPEQAAEAVGAWSVAMAVMAIPSGRLVDRAKPAWILVAGTVAVASSCLLLWRTAENAVVALVVYAVGQSLNASAVGATTARFFGRAHHGAIRSSMARIAVIGTGLGPLVFGASHHLTGSYDAALMAFALLCAPVALAAVALREPVAA